MLHIFFIYTRIHLSPWWMLFGFHSDIYRFLSIFFTYSLTLYDGAILFQTIIELSKITGFEVRK